MGQRHLQSHSENLKGACSPSETSLGSGQGLVSLEALMKPQPSGPQGQAVLLSPPLSGPDPPPTSISNQSNTWLDRRSSWHSGQPPGPRRTSWRPVHSSTVVFCFLGEGEDKGTWWTSSSTEVADPILQDPISLIPGPQPW